MIRGILLLVAAVLVPFMAVDYARASNDRSTIKIFITGSIVEGPDCIINDNNNVSVSFGDDIITYQVKDENYKQQVPYTLQCNNLLTQGLKMTLSGAAAPFDAKLFKTSNTGLGIRILDGTTEVPPEGVLKFNYSTQPVLYAVLVAQDAATLSTGPFSGTATMVITYQ